MKTYPIEHQIRQQIKNDLMEHLIVLVDTNEYYIKISAEEWHRIFKAQELNKSGITYDKDYR